MNKKKVKKFISQSIHRIEERMERTRLREVILKDASEQEVRAHYESRYAMSKKFDDQRPSFYFTQGSFNCDPLIADYKYFLQKNNITTIAIEA